MRSHKSRKESSEKKRDRYERFKTVQNQHFSKDIIVPTKMSFPIIKEPKKEERKEKQKGTLFSQSRTTPSETGLKGKTKKGGRKGKSQGISLFHCILWQEHSIFESSTTSSIGDCGFTAAAGSRTFSIMGYCLGICWD